ncbi:MAG: sugar ABC transporter ATP-binding protein [Spirochaetaceae bacterium]
MGEPRLAVEGVRKRYPGVQALKGVELTVHPGEIQGLIGENGAGKSTLIKILAGVVHPDEGTVYMNGEAVRLESASHARALGLAFIHQELNLIEYFTAPENVFLGHRLPKRGGLYSRRKVAESAKEIFRELEVELPLDEPVRYLAPGERAMVAIARAFAQEAAVYFMDEPSTSLTAEEKGHLFALIRRLRNQGKSVVYVSHNLDDVLKITDTVTVFREGSRVGHWETGELSKKALIEAMIGEAAEKRNESPVARHWGELLLEVEDLRGVGVGPVSFELHSGEILGIGGLVGSGRSTLLSLLCGAAKRDGGRMALAGGEYAPADPEGALRAGVSLIPEERRSQGLALTSSVLANALTSSLRRFSTGGWMRFQRAREAVRAAGKRVRLKTPSYDRPVNTLSGGNQQKVLFGRALLASPRILLLDEPTRGVDVGARYEIYEIIRRMAAEGVAIILVSSDFDEILSLADRILFLQEGSQGRSVANEGLTQNEYLTLCYPGVTDEQ